MFELPLVLTWAQIDLSCLYMCWEEHQEIPPQFRCDFSGTWTRGLYGLGPSGTYQT